MRAGAATDGRGQKFLHLFAPGQRKPVVAVEVEMNMIAEQGPMLVGRSVLTAPRRAGDGLPFPDRSRPELWTLSLRGFVGASPVSLRFKLSDL